MNSQIVDVEGRPRAALTSNIIAIPFAYEQNTSSGVNIHAERALQIYLKNVCVATVSAKHNNPECVVALITNLNSDDFSDSIANILRDNEIEIIKVPFDRFRFPADYLWSLAFYKLCALSHLVDMGYEKICYMDADVYIQGSFDALWQECEENLLLYDINHGLNTKDYQIICNEFDQYFESKKPKFITHYGGEFFLSNKENALRFLVYANQVYHSMISRGFQTTKGDEFILSISAHFMRDSVKNAGAYIYRFWSGVGFHLVSTCYRYNAVTVLHLPAEKERGIIRLFEKYIKNRCIPANRVVWRICRLSGMPFIDQMKSILKIIIRK